MSHALRSTLHGAANRALPTALLLKKQFTRHGYERLLLDYRRDFLAKQRLYPNGIAYRFLERKEIAEKCFAYRFLSPAGVVHEPGNTLLLKWKNNPTTVSALMAERGWNQDESVLLQTESTLFNPGRSIRMSLATALGDYLDIRNPCDQPVARDYVVHQRLIKPRSYSITGIEKVANHREIIEILVTHVEVGVKVGSGIEQGRCTGYLQSLNSESELVSAWPLKFPLTLEATVRNKPLMIIATGIAYAGPALEWERLASDRPLWMITGLRTAAPEQPLTARLLEFARNHPQSRIDIAVSRASAPSGTENGDGQIRWYGNARVQNVLQNQQADFHHYLKSGGDIVIIGHTSMGVSLQNHIRNALVETGLVASDVEATQRLRQMEQSLQLQYSLSGK